MMNENANISMEEKCAMSENPNHSVKEKCAMNESFVINENPVNRENQIDYDFEMYSAPSAIKEKRTFSTTESIFAWLCLLSGYLFCRVFPVSQSPLGGLCFLIFLFGVTVVVLVLKKCRFKALPVGVAASAIIISCALFFTANGLLHFLSYVYGLAAYCYFVYAVCGNALEDGFSNFIFIDFLKAVSVVPFYAIGHLFRAMFPGKIKRSGTIIGKLILGLGIAVIPTSLVILLLSYDTAFSDLMNRIFNWDFDHIFSRLSSLLFAVPTGMYLFGLFISSRDQMCRNIMTKEKCESAAVSVRKIPAATAFAAVTPILFVYAVFFISQWDYYISGFTGILPDNFSYAGYAREGFFQLCLVAVMNLMIILCVILFMRRKENKKSILLKVLSLLYSAFTLILISTALAKLFMYIDYYGLTHKRIYAAWLMVVLGVLFVLIALYQFFPKLKVVAVSVCAVAGLFAVLVLSNVDARIADYNVKHYMDGSLSSVDFYELCALGDAAIPALVELAWYFESEEMAADPDEGLRDDLENYLLETYAQITCEDESFWATTLPYIKAKKALSALYSK